MTTSRSVSITSLISSTGNMGTCRVGREPNGEWWVARARLSDVGEEYNTFLSFDDMPEDVKDRVAVLMAAPEEYRHENIGRKISADRFWIFLGDER